MFKLFKEGLAARKQVVEIVKNYLMQKMHYFALQAVTSCIQTH
ncbi:hypothetical protein BG20_I1088 [Candidatus Nitrosarchaeum limnium BG20]|uniref:Uncharacterized protein n=1 Tax=Candidatus Nitrosarchaeum limnium BG20 TaxID=859192 RepID=S2E0S0_9ARCH|nr:hypothetical protein BG20_I1088 [Candidatus Nitrosarchaeum limnium BG20]